VWRWRTGWATGLLWGGKGSRLPGLSRLRSNCCDAGSTVVATGFMVGMGTWTQFLQERCHKDNKEIPGSVALRSESCSCASSVLPAICQKPCLATPHTAPPGLGSVRPLTWTDLVRRGVPHGRVWDPCSLHTAEATGSKPVTPTTHLPRSAAHAAPSIRVQYTVRAGWGHTGPHPVMCESGSCFPLWLRLLGDSFRTRLRVVGDTGSGRWVTVAG
jgi:hypothetical protein